jgi:ADP-heptose:LPS heptosyltransferase
LKVALIHPGPTTWPGKNWPYERWEEITKWLRQRGFFSIAIGSRDTPGVGCDDSIAGCSTPQQLYDLCGVSSLMVGLDSMPSHIASAAETPSVILFGATEPKDIMRKAPHLIAVQASQKDADCVGAHGRRKQAVTEMPCRGDCMKAISAEMVQTAIEKLC